MEDEQEVDEGRYRSDSYYIATAFVICPHCGKQSRVAALALPDSHTRAIVTSQHTDVSRWNPACTPAFLSDVTQLAEPVRRRLLRECPHYQQGAAPIEGRWVNHCEHCHKAIADEDLHSEPGVAFCFTSAFQAAAIVLEEIQEGLEAEAAGYTMDPQYFSDCTHR
jgi:hypothetical protein